MPLPWVHMCHWGKPMVLQRKLKTKGQGRGGLRGVG